MFKVVEKADNKLSIKNTETGQIMTFKTWYEVDQFCQYLKQFQDDLLPF